MINGQELAAIPGLKIETWGTPAACEFMLKSDREVRIAPVIRARYILALTILCAVTAPFVQCANVAVLVDPGPPLRLKQRARITLLVDGEPLAGTKIGVWTNYPRYPALDIATLTSDNNGDVTLPEIAPGYYLVTFPSNFVSELAICVAPCPDLGIETTNLVPTTLDGPLEVLDRDSLALSELRMEIGPSRDPGWIPLITAAEQQANAYRVSELRGVVNDQSGAIIPGALIDIVVKGTQGKKHAAMIRTDDVGRFSAHLPDGEYVAVIWSQGFRVRSLLFTISSTGTTTELHFVLEVGAVTETVTQSKSMP